MTALVAGLGLSSHAETAIGSVVAFEGKAVASRGENAERGLTLKSPIYLRDKVVTAKSTKLQILFDDNSLVSQGPDSEMVIDEYVYSRANEKSGKCGIKLSKGVFRVITGRITDINPKRFKVRTRMATIGIRGCEIGFDIGLAQELIYVLELPPGHTMIIESHGAGGIGVGQPGQGVIEAGRHGMVFAIGAGGVQSDELTPEAARHVVDQSTPGTPANPRGPGNPIRPDGAMGSGHHPNMLPDNPPGQSPDDSDPDFKPRDIMDNAMHVPTGQVLPDRDNLPDDLFGHLTEQEIMMLAEFTGLTRAELAELEDPKLMFLLDLVRSTWATQNDGTIPPPDGNDPPPDGNDPPPDGGDGSGGAPDPVYHTQGGGAHWTWGIRSLDGLPLEVDVRPQMPVDTARIQEMIAGSTPFDLYANGVAAAVVTHADVPRMVEGMSMLEFHLGYGSHMWSGTFDMNGSPGNRLYFHVMNGDVSPMGDLVGGIVESYYLKADGLFFDNPSGNVTGRLVGQGGGAAMLPTGAIGTFDFSHGNVVTVQGIFGADLN